MSVEDIEAPPAFFDAIDRPGFIGGRLTRSLVVVARSATIIASLGLIMLALLVGLDVTFRYLTGKPLRGVLEISEVALVGITFLALPYVEISGRNMRVLFLIERARPGLQRLVALLEIPLLLIFYYLVLRIGIRDFLEAYSEGFVRSGIISIPMIIPIGFILIGCFLAVLATIMRGFFLLFSPASFITEK